MNKESTSTGKDSEEEPSKELTLPKDISEIIEKLLREGAPSQDGWSSDFAEILNHIKSDGGVSGSSFEYFEATKPDGTRAKYFRIIGGAEPIPTKKGPTKKITKAPTTPAKERVSLGQIVQDYYSRYRSFSLPKRTFYLVLTGIASIEAILSPIFVPNSIDFYMQKYRNFQKQRTYVAEIRGTTRRLSSKNLLDLVGYTLGLEPSCRKTFLYFAERNSNKGPAQIKELYEFFSRNNIKMDAPSPFEYVTNIDFDLLSHTLTYVNSNNLIKHTPESIKIAAIAVGAGKNYHKEAVGDIIKILKKCYSSYGKLRDSSLKDRPQLLHELPSYFQSKRDYLSSKYESLREGSKKPLTKKDVESLKKEAIEFLKKEIKNEMANKYSEVDTKKAMEGHRLYGLSEFDVYSTFVNGITGFDKLLLYMVFKTSNNSIPYNKSELMKQIG